MQKLRAALRPVNRQYWGATGSLKLPPDFQLPKSVQEFSRAWQSTSAGFEQDKEYKQCLKDFFDSMEGLCLAFPQYDLDQNATNIKFLLWTLMLYMPWELLPETVRRERLKASLQDPDLRRRLWLQHQEDLSQRLATDSNAGLCMSSSFALALLSFEDIRKAFIALPFDQSTVFFRDLPALILEMPELYAELSEEKKRIFAHYLGIQVPDFLLILIKKIHDQFWSKSKILADDDAIVILKLLTQDPTQALRVSSQANFVLATIYVSRRELAFAKPCLERLEQTSYGLDEDQKEEADRFLQLCRNAASTAADQPSLSLEAIRIIELLNGLNRSFKTYLAHRKLSGMFYTFGFFNAELSKKKNNKVQSLIIDIEGQIINLIAGKDPEFSAGELKEKLIQAQKENLQFHQESARNIDGDGKLGAMLNAAALSLQAYICTVTEEPDSPTGSRLSAD